MADFPEIRTGVVTQLPHTKTRAFRTAKNVMPCGIQYSYKGRDAALIGFHLSYSGITSAEAEILESHFRGQQGRLTAFHFTDPDSGVVYWVRYDMDELVLRDLGPDQVATSVSLLEERL